jgi:hypothetical protein
MPDSTADALVLADPDGNYYVLPRELIELSKVRPEAKSDLEQYVGDDTTGFATLGGGYAFVGIVSLKPTEAWSKFSPGVSWPYYLPQVTPHEGDQENPAG